MKSVASALVIAALLLAILSLQHFDVHPWVYAPIAVAVGVLAAATMQGGFTWIAVVAGALSPLAFRWLHPLSPWLAVAVFTLIWTSPRIWLARTSRSMIGLAAAAVALSLLSGWIAASFADAGIVQAIAACLFVGAALSLVPLLVRTDTPVGHALEVTARALPDSPVREALLRAADIHRTSHRDRVSDSLPTSKWRKLVQLADQRASAGDSSSAEETKALEASILTLAGELSGNAAPPAAPTAATTPETAPVEPAADQTAPAPPPAPTEVPATVIPADSSRDLASTPDRTAPPDDAGLVVNATVP